MSLHPNDIKKLQSLNWIVTKIEMSLKTKCKPETERSEVVLSVSREAASRSDGASKSGLFGGVKTLKLLKNK